MGSERTRARQPRGPRPHGKPAWGDSQAGGTLGRAWVPTLRYLVPRTACAEDGKAHGTEGGIVGSPLPVPTHSPGLTASLETK